MAQNRWPPSTKKTTFGRLTRSELMARVRSEGNSTTELRMANLLRANRVTGWRRHYNAIGRPDFVWTNERMALFVDGCFWHGHHCGRNLQPVTNSRLWADKIAGNKKRDRRNSLALLKAGWRVLRVWECVLKSKPQLVVRRLKTTLSSNHPTFIKVKK